MTGAGYPRMNRFNIEIDLYIELICTALIIAIGVCWLSYCQRFFAPFTMPCPRAPRQQAGSRPAPARPATPPPPSDQSDEDEDAPAVLISPVKARAAKKNIVSKTDIEVWPLPDAEIIGTRVFLCNAMIAKVHFRINRGVEVYLAFAHL